MVILLIILLSIASAILYRMGGSDRFNPKWRDWGVSICVLTAFALLYPLRTQNYGILAIISSFLLTWGALSTYHKWLNPLFNKPKTDCFWFNWFAHGLGIAMALFPFAWVGVSWRLLSIRAIVLGVSMMLWSRYNHNVVWDEGGRGALIVLTLLIFILTVL